MFVRREGNPGVILFVHGISGNSKETWQNGTAYWPAIVRDDPLFNGMDIAVLDYPSKFFGQGYDIDGLAEEFGRIAMDSDKDLGLNLPKYERIVVIAHSMGGIVVRKFIINTPDIRNKIKGLFLFSTPMDGSSLANVLSTISDNPAVKQLRRPKDNDEFIRRLRTAWKKTRPRFNIPTTCGYETQDTGWWIFARRVVTDLSADQLCDEGLTQLERDHFYVVKPTSRNDSIHMLLRQGYADLYPDATETLNEELNSPVAIARCDVDRYGADLSGAMADELHRAGVAWRYTRRLPEDWFDTYKPYLWRKHPPKLLVIHLSCFQQGNESPESAAERTKDFIELMKTLKPDRTKLLVYSGAFFADRNFLRNNIPRDLSTSYLREQRLFTLPMTPKKAFSQDIPARRAFRDLVLEALR